MLHFAAMYIFWFSFFEVDNIEGQKEILMGNWSISKKKLSEFASVLEINTVMWKPSYAAQSGGVGTAQKCNCAELMDHLHFILSCLYFLSQSFIILVLLSG